MDLKEIVYPNGTRYSWIDGGYHQRVSYKEAEYDVILLPFAMTGSACTILRVTDTDDPNNVTRSSDERRVFYKRYNDFKVENIDDSIKEFIRDYAK